MTSSRLLSFFIGWALLIVGLICFQAAGCDAPPTPPPDSSAPDVVAPREQPPEPRPVDVAQAHKDMRTITPEECGRCHTQHFEEWRGSMHAYASKDPVFLAMSAKGLQETKGKLDQFCIQCHAPNASKLGLTPVIPTPQGIHQMKLDMKNPAISHGVQCVTCHTTQSVEATLNAKFTLSKTHLFGPTGSAAAQSAHAVKASTLLGQSRMCGSCHNVVNPKGALLENTFSEWYASDYNGNTPQSTQHCQSCHMPTYTGPINKGGRVTKLHRHTFVGVDQALIPNFPYKKEQAALVKKLLQSCAKVRIERVADHQGQVALVVHVTSINNGHNLPSGSTADRQVWIHLTIKNDAGKMLYESGMLDKNGDLMDRIPGHSTNPNGDPYLFMFGQFLFNETGDHVNFPWQASRTKDNLLPPGQTKWREYLIPRNLLLGQRLQVKATLRYRTFPPFLIRKLIEEGHMKPNALEPIPIIDMAGATASWTIR